MWSLTSSDYRASIREVSSLLRQVGLLRIGLMRSEAVFSLSNSRRLWLGLIKFNAFGDPSSFPPAVPEYDDILH